MNPTNEMVAEKVFGWKYSEAWEGWIPPEQIATPGEMWERTEYGFVPARGAAVPGIKYTGDMTKVVVPDYLNDMGAAMSILVRLSLEGAPSIGWVDQDLGWLCTMHGLNGKVSTACRTNPCKAIAIAALHFKGCSGG